MRPRKRCLIAMDPAVTVFKPAGVPYKRLPTLVLELEELEALRLADTLGLQHMEAGQRMGVSRATFGRIVKRARAKIAEALVEGKAVIVRRQSSREYRLGEPDEQVLNNWEIRS